jgi:hypothetical protein
VCIISNTIVFLLFSSFAHLFLLLFFKGENLRKKLFVFFAKGDKNSPAPLGVVDFVDYNSIPDDSKSRYQSLQGLTSQKRGGSIGAM